MDLHELFPEDLDAETRPSSSLVRSRNLVQRRKNQQRRYGGEVRQLPQDAARRSQGSIGLAQRQRSASGASGTYQYQTQGQLSPHGSVGEAESPSAYFGVNQNSYNPDFMSNVPGMEFLNHLGGPSVGTKMETSPMSSMAAMQATAENSPGLGMNFEVMNDTTGQYEPLEYDTGFDFGVGMGLDFPMGQQHGWGDAQGGFDLDGFFFGGSGS